MNKKILSVIMASAMLSANGAVFAEEQAANDIMLISETLQVSAESSKVTLGGKISSNEDGQLLITDGNSETVINFDENTLFITADGNKISKDDINAEDSVTLIADSAMTRSLPPQCYGYIVIKHGEEDATLPIYAEIATVSEDENGNTVVLSRDGNYRIVIGEETRLMPLATRQIVGLDEIKEGARILVYSDIMTMSIPAVVPAERVIVLGEEVQGSEDAAEEAKIEEIIVNGEKIDGKIIDNNGILMLPVRKICEKLGLDVTWNGERKAIAVGTVQMGAEFNIGVNSYKKAKMMAQQLSAAPVLDEDTTYVPSDFFAEIAESEVIAEDGAIKINYTVNVD